MTPDVLVVGGGAIGASIAYEVARTGATVRLVERGPRLADGCSYGSAGLICPSHSAPLATPAALRQGIVWMFKRSSPLYLKPRPAVVPWIARFTAAATPGRARAGTAVIRELSRASLALHAALADAGLDTTFERRGILNAYETDSGLVAGTEEAAAAREAGLRVETLDAAGAREVEPALSGAVRGGVLYPDEAHCDPVRFVEAVGNAAAERGARIETGVEVQRLHAPDGRVERVETTAGVFAPGTVVLAAGAWTPRLARDAGVYVPVEGGKGYHVELAPGERPLRVPVFMQESRVIATPYPDRLRLAGTLELAGLDLSIDPVRVEAIVASARRNLSTLPAGEPRGVWRGLRPCAPDGLPIVGRPARVENLILATGHAMMGLTLAPVTGRLVAELVTGREPSHDLAPLSPDRFKRLLAVPARRPRDARPREVAAPGP